MHIWKAMIEEKLTCIGETAEKYKEGRPQKYFGERGQLKYNQGPEKYNVSRLDEKLLWEFPDGFCVALYKKIIQHHEKIDPKNPTIDI